MQGLRPLFEAVPADLMGEATMSVGRISDGGPAEDAFGYSRAVVTGDCGGYMGWTAGCSAIVNGSVQHPGDPYGQAIVAFATAVFALERAGFTRADTVMTRMYVVDLRTNAELVGAAHAQFFGEVRPAATMVGVGQLMAETALVEVEVVAWRPDSEVVIQRRLGG